MTGKSVFVATLLATQVVGVYFIVAFVDQEDTLERWKMRITFDLKDCKRVRYPGQSNIFVASRVQVASPQKSHAPTHTLSTQNPAEG